MVRGAASGRAGDAPDRMGSHVPMPVCHHHLAHPAARRTVSRAGRPPAQTRWDVTRSLSHGRSSTTAASDSDLGFWAEWPRVSLHLQVWLAWRRVQRAP